MIYELYIGSPEETSRRLFTHSVRKTEKEFFEDVKRAIVHAVRDLLSEGKKDEFIELLDFEVEERVVKHLEKMGYKEVKADVSVSLFGWSNLLGEDAWESYMTERDKEIIKAVSEDPEIKRLLRKG